MGFYRKFVPNFVHIALSFTDLTKLICENCHELLFQTLKLSLPCFPILKLPDLHDTFVLQTDASDRGLDAVLFQFEKNKKLPIAYACRKLKDGECEKECLAVVWAIH